jgi:hypothetical protein
MMFTQEQLAQLSTVQRKAILAIGQTIEVPDPTDATAVVKGKAKAGKSADALLNRAIEIIQANKRVSGYKGCHSVFSGFNDLLVDEFKLSKPELFERLDALVASGKLATMPAKGGYMYYLPGEKPERKPRTADDIRAKLGL